MPRARVLMVTRNLPPLLGGMERLNHHLLRELAVDFEVAVCCPRECQEAVPAGIETLTAPLRPLPAFLAGSALNAVRLARRLRPHLVLAGSGLTAPLARLAAGVAGARSAAYLHGLDIVVDHAIYQRLWASGFHKLDLVFANSRHTAGLAARAGVAPERLQLLHPGVELPQWEPSAGTAFRERHGLGSRPLLLSVGRLTARKGLAEFIEAGLPELVRAVPETLLLVIGGEAVHSLKADGASQRQRILDAAQRRGLQQHVRLLGEVDETTLRGAFFAATALVFPVLDLPGDVEGFGMVAIEAAAHGVPTVAFAVGGVVDAVAPPVSGALLQPGDYAGMARALASNLQGDRPEARQARRDFAQDFAWSRFGERLRHSCARTMERGREH